MNIDKINLKLQYEKYVNPNFPWDDQVIYIYDKLFSDEAFIECFKNKINWKFFSIYNDQLCKNLTVCKKYKDYIHWSSLSSCSVLSTKFLTTFAEYIDWDMYCQCNQLTVHQLFKFAPLFTKSTWLYVCEYQSKINKKFIDKYYEKMSYNKIMWNIKIPANIRAYYIDKCKKNNLI